RAAAPLRQAATTDLWRRTGTRSHRAVLHRRPLFRCARRQPRTGLVLGEHLEPAGTAVVGAAGADLARGGAGASPAGGAGGRTGRAAAVPPPRLHLRLRRRLGPVFG